MCTSLVLPPQQSIFIPISIIMPFNKSDINEIMQYMLFCDGLFSFSIIFLKVIQVFVCISCLLFSIAVENSMKWRYHSVLNCSSTEEYLKNFLFWAIINKTSLNVHVQVFCMYLCDKSKSATPE